MALKPLFGRSLQRAADRMRVDVDDAARTRLAQEQLRNVWMHSQLGIVIASGFALLLAVYLAGVVPAAGPVRLWLAVKLAVAGGRLLQARHYARQGFHGGPQALRATHGSLAADGLVWGVGGFLMMAQAVPIPIASLVVASLACISCVATFGLQVSLSATAAYVIPIVLPTVAGLVGRADDFGLFGAGGLALLLVLQLATAARSEQRLAEALLLQMQAQALAREKDQALELALRQSAVKSQFLANISHELRTPMHGILGLARVLHLELADEALLRRVELIEHSGQHLLSLINDLLDISRIESGHLAMQRQPFELAAQVDQVAAVHAMRADDKGLQFEQVLQFERPQWVSGDPARFRQVLHNLLGNAIKFTPQGQVRLTVQRLRGDGGLVQVSVADSGPGISPQELDHVFEAFRQSGTTPAGPLEGAGLGLTIARELARAMGGDVVAQSTVGCGSTMTFTAQLPITAAPAAAPVPLQPPALAAARGAHVLLAEDDDVNALIATAYLERMGVQVERVADGRMAVIKAMRSSRRPDLVLMDCRMPAMDGYAATRAIREREAALGLSPLPVVALTATVTDDDRRSCMEAGMSDFVSKPFTLEELSALLDRWLPRPLQEAATNPGAAATDEDRDARCRS
jgi:two-component system, sensor histidine kinase